MHQNSALVHMPTISGKKNLYDPTPPSGHIALDACMMLRAVQTNIAAQAQ